MKEFYDDMPLFSESILTTDLTASDKATLQVERSIPIETEHEEKRKDKLLKFTFKLFFVLLAIIVGFVLLDVVEHKFNIENPLLSEAFELMKYAITAVLGYLFANNAKK